MSGNHFDRLTETVHGARVVYARLKEPVGEFVYAGRVEGGELQLWTEDGRWRDSGEAHPFDLALTRAQGA
jgi:hypothetical protein